MIAFQSDAFQHSFQQGAMVVVAPQETPAGRPRRKFYIEINGEMFWVRSPAEARELLLQARRMAKQSADKLFSEAVATKPLQIKAKAPKLVGPAEVRQEIKAAQKEINAIYRSARIDYELYYLLHRKMGQEDEDTLIWLM